MGWKAESASTAVTRGEPGRRCLPSVQTGPWEGARTTDLGSVQAFKMSFYKLMLSFHQDPRGCLASLVFRGKEESLAPTDVLAVRGTQERTVSPASLETGG